MFLSQIVRIEDRRRVGEALRRGRQEAGLTLSELGARVEIRGHRLSLIERGVAKLRPAEFMALKSALPAFDAIFPRAPHPIVPGHPAGPHAPRPTAEPAS
jgi:DNA-binding XRE family transcriptional regulator